MLTQSASVCKGWRRLVFSLRSSLTLTHSLASTLSQTCWTAAFAWRCHSSLCRSDDGRKGVGGGGERESKEKEPRDSPKKCLHFLLIFPPFYFLCGCFSAVWHLPGRKCLVLQGASRHLELLSPPLQSPPFSLLINKTDLQGQCGNRLRRGLARVPTSGSSQAGRLPRDTERNNASSFSTALDLILWFHFLSPLTEERAKVRLFIFMRRPHPAPDIHSVAGL